MFGGQSRAFPVGGVAMLGVAEFGSLWRDNAQVSKWNLLAAQMGAKCSNPSQTDATYPLM